MALSKIGQFGTADLIGQGKEILIGGKKRGKQKYSIFSGLDIKSLILSKLA